VLPSWDNIYAIINAIDGYNRTEFFFKISHL